MPPLFHLLGQSGYEIDTIKIPGSGSKNNPPCGGIPGGKEG